MFKFICLAFVYFMTVSLARADELSCTNLQRHTEIYATYRDKGLTVQQISDTVEESDLGDTLKNWIIYMLPHIFEAKSVSPSVLGSIVYDKCIRTRSRLNKKPVVII